MSLVYESYPERMARLIKEETIVEPDAHLLVATWRDCTIWMDPKTFQVIEGENCAPGSIVALGMARVAKKQLTKEG